MKVVTASNKFVRSVQDHLPQPVLFLAGGISGCENWQREQLDRLEKCEDLLILNPRRANWTTGFRPDDQVEWEFAALRASDAISFWFPRESLCPIALFELGAWSHTGTPLFVGCDPNYPRIWDIRKQLRLVRPDVTVCTSLPDLSDQVHSWYQTRVRYPCRMALTSQKSVVE